MEKNLTLKNISKKYSKLQILKNINLDINEGDFIVLVGPSGCGKSTLLNIISGLDQDFGGEIFFGEQNITHFSPKNRDVAMVFQSYALYPNMTVKENIAFGLKNRKQYSQNDIDKIVEQVAESLKIKDLLKRKPAELSGGQRQRVAMGRAISRSPKLFLFDEPLSNLDAKLRVQMRQEIKQLHQKLKTTIIYVTHDQIEAMTLADKIAIMKGGVIKQFGTPEEIYYSPKNLFVASFIGLPNINLIPITLQKKKGEFSFEITNQKNKTTTISLSEKFFDKSLKKQTTPFLGKEILLGIRAEDLEVIHGNKTFFPKEKVLEVSVNFRENTGSDEFYFTELNQTKVICRSLLVNKKDLANDLKINFLLSKAMFFDPESGERI